MTTWLHYIGKRRYSPRRFVEEAGKFGVSRKTPLSMAQSLAFGDRIVFARYNGEGDVVAFAEGVIRGIALDQTLAAEVGKVLIERGVARGGWGGGGGHVERECRDYEDAGSLVVDEHQVTLGQIATLAAQIAQDLGLPRPVFCMFKAELLHTYDGVQLQPAPRFTRSLVKIDDAPGGIQVGSSSVSAVRNYRAIEDADGE